MALDLEAEVNALAAKIAAETVDQHERAVFLSAVKGAFEALWAKAASEADEQRAQLVLEKRAATGGKSVADQKADVALLLKKHPSTVTAIEVLSVAILKPAPPPPVTPVGPPLPGAGLPVDGGK